MPAWSRPRLPAWVKRKKKRGRRPKKKTRKKTKKEGGTASHWLRELLKLLTSVNPEFKEQVYHYDPRHFTKDPEYKYSDKRTQAFKREIPAPDVHYFSQPGDQPTHLGNYSRYRKREDREGWIHVNAIDPANP